MEKRANILSLIGYEQFCIYLSCFWVHIMRWMKALDLRLFANTLWGILYSPTRYVPS